MSCLAVVCLASHLSFVSFSKGGSNRVWENLVCKDSSNMCVTRVCRKAGMSSSRSEFGHIITDSARIILHMLCYLEWALWICRSYFFSQNRFTRKANAAWEFCVPLIFWLFSWGAMKRVEFAPNVIWAINVISFQTVIYLKIYFCLLSWKITQNW